MNNIKRIAIIGCPGSGKSVLARKLHQILNLPVYNLDKYFWKPNWEQPKLDEYKIIHDKLCDEPKWIIDGMNTKILEYRIERAEVIIFLDLPIYICLWRIFKRAFKYYGKETPSSAKDCPEQFNWRFIKFIKWVVFDFKCRNRKKIIDLLNIYNNQKKIYIFKSQKEIDSFVSALRKNPF